MSSGILHIPNKILIYMYVCRQLGRWGKTERTGDIVISLNDTQSLFLHKTHKKSQASCLNARKMCRLSLILPRLLVITLKPTCYAAVAIRYLWRSVAFSHWLCLSHTSHTPMVEISIRLSLHPLIHNSALAT